MEYYLVPVFHSGTSARWYVVEDSWSRRRGKDEARVISRVHGIPRLLAVWNEIVVLPVSVGQIPNSALRWSFLRIRGRDIPVPLFARMKIVYTEIVSTKRKENIGKKSWYKLWKYIFISYRLTKKKYNSVTLENKSKFHSMRHYRYCNLKRSTCYSSRLKYLQVPPHFHR